MRSLRRGWAAACAAAYFVTNVAAAHAVEKSLWEERRVALRRTTWGARAAPVARFAQVGSLPIFDGGSTPSQPPSNFFKAAVPFDVVSTALPFGAVSEMREGRPGAPVVFLVQDVHGNDGAQKNIGGLLTEWAARGVTLVGVEGAWVSIDLAAFRRHPSPRSVSLVADALRKAGWLSGAEWAGMTTSVPLDLVGVESPDLYRTNVRAARDCVARRPTVETFLKNLSHALQNQKDRFYSPQLKAFDLHIKDYHEGREGLGAYARSLSDLPGSGVQAGPQVKKFLKAVDWESRLNFEKVEADRQALMDRLTRDLGRKELNGLFSQAVAYRTGKQTNGDFFSYLKTLCAKTRTPLASYQSFADYIAYVGLVQSINRADLLSELAMWETGLAGRLANTPEERRLVAMDRDASLLRRLLENEMSPDDWAQFNKRRNEIVALPARLREFGDFQEPQGGMEALFRSHEEFCRLAMARNGVLVSNLMSQIQLRKASRAVLVAGGFHTPGLQSELMKRGCSTVLVTPRIEKVEGKPLDVFARDPLPFDHLFAGKPISLPAELLFNDGRRAHFLGGQVSSEALAIAPAGDWDRDLKKWLEDQGFTVTKVTRSTEGLVRLEVVLRGIPLVLLSGPKVLVESAKIPRGSKQEKTILSNGHCVLTYVDSPSAVQIFWDLIRHFARSIGTIVVKGITMLVPSGQGTSPVETTWLGTLFLVLLPAKWLSEMRVVPVGPSSWEISDSGSRTIDFVREGTSDYYKIMANSDQVGRINYVETNRGILLVSVKVDKKQNGYGSSAILKLALRAARISNLAPQDVPFPFIVSEVENPWLFQYLKRTIFENGTMELSPVTLGASLRADTIRNNWFDEKNLNFESLSGNGNIDPNSRNYVSSFHVRGILRKELKTDTEEGRETPENHQFHISRLGLAVRVSLTDLSGKEVASAIVGGKRGAIEIQNISIEPGESTCTYDLIAGAVKEFLLLKGQGRVLLRGVIDPQVKRVAKEMFGDNLVMAPKGFGRSLSNGPWKDAIDPFSTEFHRLLEDPNAAVDLAGTLTPEARQALWPKEELPELVTATTPAPSVKVNFIPVREQNRITENLPSGFSDNDLYDVEIDGMVVGTAVFSETALALRLSDLNISVEHRRKGHARAVYESLAKRAALILYPEQNKNGPVPFKGINIANPIAFQIRSELCEPNTMEIIDVGSRASDNYLTSSVAWTTSSREDSGQFGALVGPSNIETKGPNSGKYRRHFDFRGRPNRAITEEAEREFLQAQLANPIRVLSSPRPSFNGFAFLGGGFPFDPLIGLTVAVLFLGAMLFKREILNWLDRRVSSGVYAFVNSSIPDLSGFRPRITHIFIRVIGILIEQSVEILGRLFGIGQLRVPATLGILPQGSKAIEINTDPASFVGGIGVSRRSANDTLSDSDREVFSKALGAIVPNVFDMQGVEVLIDPRRVDIERNLVEELKNKMGVNGGVAGEKSPEKLDRIIQRDPASIHSVRGFSSRPNGVNSLAETCVEAARTGDANASGAALAAWDDSKFLAGPNPEVVAALLALLVGDKTDQAVGLTDQFAEAYNRVRAGLLLPKLLSGTLMKPSNGSDLRSGILLNISALFDQQADDTAKNNTWLALAAALSARERNPNVPLGLVVHGVNVNEQFVTDALSRSVPRWVNFMTDGVSLFVQGNTVGKTVFVNDKFSLKALRINSLWNRPLTVLGLSAEAIAESIDQDKSVDLIPLDVFVNKQLQQVLQQMRFILRNA